mmetsp:Transcript_156024/g.291151  ORF Transcript_156024/g.291151 Transcript_156024/m.291151 type:complete len:741 (+) Transcript_156024:65-2287(+)
MVARGMCLSTASIFMSIGTRLILVPAVLLFAATGLSADKYEQQVENRRSVMRSDIGARGHPTLTKVDALRVQEPDLPEPGEPGGAGFQPGGEPAAPGAPAGGFGAGAAGAGEAGAPAAGAGGPGAPAAGGGEPGAPATAAAEPAAAEPGVAGEGAAAEGEAEGGAEGNETEAGESEEGGKEEAGHLGIMLLGFITFMITLFYGVNYKDADVRFSVWCTLQDSISLLCGVLIFHAFKDCMVVQFGETDDSEQHNPPDIKSLIIAFVRMLVAFWMSQFTLLRYRKDERKLMAWGIVLGNVVAFTAIDSLGMIQQISPFADTPANAFLGVIIASVMMFSMSISGHIVRQYWMTWETGTITDEEKKWDHQCEHTEDHFSGIAVGMLLSIVIRYSITGEMPPIWGAPRYKTESECTKLFGVSLALSLPIFFISLATHAMAKGTSGNKGLKWIVRCMKVFQTTMAMTMGWSLMYACRWQWWTARHGVGEVMTARLMLALIFSYVGFIFIVVVDRIGDKVKVGKEGFAVVNEAFSLGIGMSWEGAFSQSVDEFAEEYGGEGGHARAWTEVLLAVFLIILILPAWVWYILPKVLAGPEITDDNKDAANDVLDVLGLDAADECEQLPDPGEQPPGAAGAGAGEGGGLGDDAAKTTAEQAPLGETAGAASAEAYGEDAGAWDAQDQAWADGGQGDQGWDDGGWGNNGGGWGAGGGRTSTTWGAGGKGRGADGKGGRGAKGALEEDGSAAF